MLFTYKNHPILKLIEQGNLDGFQVLEEINNLQLLNDWWEKYSPNFKSKIQKISDSFWEAMTKAEKKLRADDVVNQTPKASGTLLFRDFSYCYYVDKDEVSLVYFFYKNDLAGYLYINEVTKKSYGQMITSKKDESDHLKDLLVNVYLYINFLKYAPIEVKYLNGNKKLKDVHGKYVNQTELNIELIDSTWFTTLVRSEGFKVRGHFRLQPFGQGLKEKKLIWISDFEKQGYVRNFKRPLDLD